MEGINRDRAALIGILACPACRSPLRSEPTGLACDSCGGAFSYQDGVPLFTGGDVTGAPPVSPLRRLHHAILGNHRVYDFQQAHFGAEPVVDRLRKELADVHDATVLDIGAGTGVVADLLPKDNRYVWLDNDFQKLRGLLSRGVGGFAALGDATHLPLRTRIADLVLMVEVSHHIPDDALERCLEEASRVTRDRFLFVDAVRGPRLRSKFMWHLDLGRFPRPEAEILEALSSSFRIERVDRFGGVNHDHVMCVCMPRTATPAQRGEP